MSGSNFTEGVENNPPSSAAPGGKSPVLLGLKLPQGGEQFLKSSNRSTKNGKMAMYLITRLESWLSGLSKK